MASLTDPSLINANAAMQAPGSMGGGLSTPPGAGASTPSLTGTPGATPGGDSGLQSYLASNYDPYASTIMGQYAAAGKATGAQAESQQKAITDTGNFNIGYQSEIDKAQGTQSLEGTRGFVVNPGAIKILQDSSTKRIRDLTTQMNDALANNQTALASSLANLSLQEQTALTQARTTFLSQYFQGKEEQRAEQSFQTPEQKAVMDLGNANPGAGITPSDTLAQAQAKVVSSPTYKLGLQSSQAGINLQGAQAGLAGSQTVQQNIVNKFLQGDTTQFKSDIDGLLNNTVSVDNLHAKYDGLPNGAGPAVIANILSQAQAKGYQPFQAGLKQSAQSQQNSALNSGNPFNLFGAGITQGVSALGSALTGPGSLIGGSENKFLNSQAPTTGTTKNGLNYTIKP